MGKITISRSDFATLSRAADRLCDMANAAYTTPRERNTSRILRNAVRAILTDIPYNIGKNAYGSNPSWYIDGDNKNGESELAGEEFFDTDKDFRPAEFMHFCSQMLRPEPKEAGKAPCMIVFCEFEQQFYLIELAKRYGLNHYINLVFRKNYSAQVLKANMRVVGNCEYGLILYRDKLPKFNNGGGMIFNCMEFPRDLGMAKCHPTQKPLPLLRRLIEIFSDPDDVVIDPCAGSGSTLIAAAGLNRKAYGFEIKKNIYSDACDAIRKNISFDLFSESGQLKKRQEYIQQKLFVNETSQIETYQQCKPKQDLLCQSKGGVRGFAHEMALETYSNVITPTLRTITGFTVIVKVYETK